MRRHKFGAMQWRNFAMSTVSVAGLLCCGTGQAQEPALIRSATLRLPALAQVPERSQQHSGQDTWMDPNSIQGGEDNAVKDDLFAGTEKFAKGASNVTEVNMDPESLEMVRGEDAKQAHRMVLDVVRTYEYDKPGMYNVADLDEFRHRISTGDWHCSVHTRDLKRNESTDICNRRRGNDMVESAIITAAPKELTFIHKIHRISPGDSELNPGRGSNMSRTEGLSPETMLARMGPQIEAQMTGVKAQLEAQKAEIEVQRERVMAEAGAVDPSSLLNLKGPH